MRAAGRAGGRKSPGLGKLPTKERESLRAYLRREVDPAELWSALQAALQSENQTARVSAAKVLLQELYEEKEKQDWRTEYQTEMKAAVAKFDEWLPRAMATVVARLLTTGKAHPSDAGVVHRTIELVEKGDPRTVSNPTVTEWTWQAMGPLFERLREERSVEEEIEHRVAERMAHLEREREELAAQRAEFAST